MSEFDASRHLQDTARLRALGADKLMLDLESTQRMPIFDRRMRATEGAVQHRDNLESAPVSVRNFPVYLKDGPTVAYGREPDFRDGRCVHGESHFTCGICTVQDGRRDV
jgi:hypothetical protein